ncbi:hypothetical protein ACTG9Q_31425 [Actinokineospora sp. 24-640]
MPAAGGMHQCAADTSAETVLAAGAALYDASVVFAAFGWQAVVRRLPDPVSLAHIGFRPRAACPDDIDRAAALFRRRADHHQYMGWDLRPDQVATLAATAESAGVRAAVVSADTVCGSLLPTLTYAEAAGRPAPWRAGSTPGPGTLLVLGGTEVTTAALLRAGEATSAVLLAATRLGLSSCALTWPLARKAVSTALERGVDMFPLVVIRVGLSAE